jgi:cell division protein FtsB
MRKRNYIQAHRSRRQARRKKVLFAGAALLAVYLLASFILGEMGLVKYYRMKAQYQALHADIVRLKQDNGELLKQVRSLKTDPACIERIARDKLGLARPGEIVYYYDVQDKFGTEF